MGRTHSMAVTATTTTPGWITEVEESLRALQKLPPGWDSHGGRPLHPHIGQAASTLLQQIVLPETPRPAVVPTGRGGVQFEWHVNGVDLEIEARTAGEFQVFLESP